MFGEVTGVTAPAHAPLQPHLISAWRYKDNIQLTTKPVKISFDDG